jgi:HAD superfamily hydrolase (TIGR01509 family)
MLGLAMISAVIFDLDDLLSDTESLHCRAYQAVLRQHGVEVSDEHYHDHWVRQGLGIADLLRHRGLAHDPASLRRAKAVEYKLLVETCCQPMPGALGLLDRLRGRKVLGLASSSYADAVEVVLAKLGIADRFACIVTGDQVRRVKPWPDIFLEAARRLRAAPQHCVVIEDAEKGVLAAKAAGMKCIAVPSPRTAGNDFSAADLVVQSLGWVTVEMIEGL